MTKYLPTTDSLGITLNEILSTYSVPSFVKTSSANQDLSQIPDAAFGDPINREFPCHTKSATWLSCAYFAHAFDQLPEQQKTQVRDRLIKRAEFFNILPEFRRLLYAKSGVMQKAAATYDAPDDYYMIVKYASGNVIRQGLLDTEEAVNTASNWLVENRNDLTLPTCAEYAGRIIKRANDLGMALDHRDHLERMRGIGISDLPSIVRAINVRAGLIKDAALSKRLRDLADSLDRAELGSLDAEMMKVAQAIDEADIVGGLVSKRIRGEIQLPEDVIYQHSLTDLKKMASETVHLQTGELFDLSKLAGVSRLDFEAALGSELAEALYDDLDFSTKEAAAVLPTLPRTDAERLSAFLNDKGIKPELATKAASAIEIPQELFDFYGA